MLINHPELNFELILRDININMTKVMGQVPSIVQDKVQTQQSAAT